MNKYLRTILCIIASLAITSNVVYATGNMNLIWRGDYSNNDAPRLVLTFTSPAQYIQQVGAVIYDADIAAPTVDDYVQMGEVTSIGGAKTELSFDLTNVFNETDGAYKVEIYGSGHMNEECIDYANLYVINKSRIAGLLTSFKNSSSSDFATVLDGVMLPLQLADENNSTRKVQRISKMLSMRAMDFAGEFPTLDDVRNSWIISDLLVYMEDVTATTSDIKNSIYAIADIIGIDETDPDFVLYNDELFTDIDIYRREYNGGKGIQCASDLKDYIGECLGVIVANNSSNDEIATRFEKYIPYYDVSAPIMKSYSGFSNNQKDKVLRALYNKNFKKASEVVTAFEKAVTAIANGESVSDGNNSPQIGSPRGNGPSGSVSGGNITQPNPPTTFEFKDVQSSHWAHNDITILVNKGIVNGYDDNTFRPNDNVTRAEFVKMVIGGSGMFLNNASCDFSDVSLDEWSYKYIASAYEYNIVGGIDEKTFDANNNITRQDAAVIIARILNHYGILGENAGSNFADIESVSDYAKDSVEILAGMGVVNGYSDNMFLPDNTLTRAESAVIISRLIKLL